MNGSEKIACQRSTSANRNFPKSCLVSGQVIAQGAEEHFGSNWGHQQARLNPGATLTRKQARKIKDHLRGGMADAYHVGVNRFQVRRQFYIGIFWFFWFVAHKRDFLLKGDILATLFGGVQRALCCRFGFALAVEEANCIGDNFKGSTRGSILGSPDARSAVLIWFEPSFY